MKKNHQAISSPSNTILAMIVAVFCVGMSPLNAQWVPKTDVDNATGFIKNGTISIVGVDATTSGASSAAESVINLNLSNSDTNSYSSYEVILKAYGPQGVNSTPLFAKLMSKVNYTGSFTSNFKHPTNTNFSLPVGMNTLVAEVYEVTDGALQPGWTLFGDILKTSNIVPTNNYALLQAKKKGTFVVDYGVSNFEVFNSRLVSGSVIVNVNPVYSSRATSLQRRLLDTRARDLLTSELNRSVVALNLGSPTSPAPSWSASVSRPSAFRAIASIQSAPVAANRVLSFVSSIRALERTSTLTFPEGNLVLTIRPSIGVLN